MSEPAAITPRFCWLAWAEAEDEATAALVAWIDRLPPMAER